MSEVDTSDGWAAYIEYPFISSIFERLKDSTELLLLLQSNALAPASFRFSFRHSTAFRCDVMVKSTWKNPRHRQARCGQGSEKHPPGYHS